MKRLRPARWLAGVACLLAPWAGAQQLRVRAVSAAEVAQAQSAFEEMLRSGQLRPARVHADTLLAGRRHERFTQLHRGVPVLGAELVRQRDASGHVLSLFGTFHDGLEVEVRPRLSSGEALARLSARGIRVVASAPASLVVVPAEGGQLAWALTGMPSQGDDVREYFVAATDGHAVGERSVLHRQEAAVGRGRGVFGNEQKLSASSAGAGFVAQDQLRPAQITTFDMRGDPGRTLSAIVGSAALGPDDIARDDDNDWSDGPVVDAHAYLGFAYDYFFSRHGRRSWDEADGPLRGLVHPVRLEDLEGYVRSGGYEHVELFYANAFFCCSGSLLRLGGFMVFGEGLPAENPLGAREYKPLAGGLDVVAHEMTHGMTAFTSRLFVGAESAALNESFSDQMAVAVDFFFRPEAANYRLGEQIVAGGVRDMAEPWLFGDADHVTRLGPRSQDPHSLASLSNHAYYLAIEGGSNRTSGLAVQGVGSENRDQIERVFYRAYQFVLGPDADYCDAAAATLLSARELFGAGSPAERAVLEAWRAVGIADRCRVG